MTRNKGRKNVRHCAMCNRAKTHIRHTDDGRIICTDCLFIYTPMIAAGLKLSFLLFVLTLLFIAPVAADTVFFEDSRVRINAIETVTGTQPVIIGTIQSKGYNGDMNLFFGFDKDVFSPTFGRLYSTEEYEQAYTCPYDTRLEAGKAVCYYSDENGTERDHFRLSYDRLDIPSQTAYINQYRSVTYGVGSVKKITGYEYDGKNTWYLIQNIPITPDTPVTYVIKGRTLIGDSAKYDVGFYPSSYGATINGLHEAVVADKFYFLDPFINSTDYEIGNLSNTTNYWGSDRNDSTTAHIAAGGTVLQYGNGSKYAWVDNSSNTGASFGIGHQDQNDFGAATTFFTVNSNAYVTQIENSLREDVGGNPNVDIVAELWNVTTASYLPSDRIAISERFPVSTLTASFVDYNLSFNSTHLHANTWYALSFRRVDHSFDATNFVLSAAELVSGLPNLARSGTFGVWSNWDPGNAWQGTFKVYGQLYDPALDMYLSNTIPISFNATNFTATLTDAGIGTSGLNVSCNDGVNWTGNFSAVGGVTQCPVVGDGLQYRITLYGGNTTESPIVENLTIRFVEDLTLNNAPNVTTPSFSPATPNASQTVTGQTTYSDADNDAGTVYYRWYVNGLSVWNDSVAAQNGFTINATLNSTNYSAGQTVALTVNASDGVNWSVNRQNSFVVAADTTAAASGATDWVEIIIFVTMVIIAIGAGVMAYNSGSLIMGGVSTIFFILIIQMVNSGTLSSFSTYGSDLSVFLLILAAVVIAAIVDRGGNA